MKPRVDTLQLLKWEVLLIITGQIYNLPAQVETGMTALSWPALLVAGGVAGVGKLPSSSM